MAAQLSKADQIRKLLHLSNAEIARRVGVLPEYVRAVRQRTSPSGNPVVTDTEAAWKAANAEYLRTYHRERFRERYATDATFREWHKRRVRLRRAEARAS